MWKFFLSFCVCGWVFISCSTNESKVDDNSIAGVYVREYSSEILNQLSGEKVGMRTIRDTIKVSKSQGGYQVVNTKWRMNDYDQEGWQDMKHGETKPLPPFDATYDEVGKTLTAKSSGMVPALHIDQGKLSVGPDSKIAYTKVD